MTEPTTAAGRELLEWVAFVEKIDDPAGNTIYDEIRRNFLPAIEAEARQQNTDSQREALDAALESANIYSAGDLALALARAEHTARKADGSALRQAIEPF